MTEISKLRRRRTSKKNNILKWTLSEVGDLLKDEQMDKEDKEIELSARLDLLLDSVNVIKKLDDEIAELIDNDEEAEQDEIEASVYHVKVGATIKKIEYFFRNQQLVDQKRRNIAGTDMAFQGDAVHEHGSGSSRGSSPERGARDMGVKLPKIKIKAFKGDVAEWKTFLDTFEAAVGSKTHLTAIQKFTYLRGYMDGNALQCIEGVPLSNENYIEAMNLLKERYGNSQLIISTHMNRLTNLERIFLVQCRAITAII